MIEASAVSMMEDHHDAVFVDEGENSLSSVLCGEFTVSAIISQLLYVLALSVYNED